MDLIALAESWKLHLRAERKSPMTLRSYGEGVSRYLAWCASEGREPVLDVATVLAWTNHMLAEGRAPATILARQKGVRRFSAWLAEKDEIPADQLAHLRPPKLDEPVVPDLTIGQVTALLATCKGKEFRNVRDRAVIRLMTETGLRASEVIGMTTADLNLTAGLAVIRRGKGGKGRIVPISPQCAAAIDDYLRVRRRHKLAAGGALWLGEGGRTLGYAGLYSSLERRGQQIGMPDMHPHRLRHTAAVRWLRKGGSPTGLMAVAGWSSLDMLRRYIRAAESDLAAEESRRLDLGDF